MISVSILGIKENKLKNYIKLDNTNCDSIHIDIMDNKFVPNTNEYEEKYIFNKDIDIHLMVEDVNYYIDKYKYLNPKYITFHIEVKQDINKLINKIKDLGIKVGIAIKPNTDINLLKPYLKDIDRVLVMSVFPGKSGQSFIDDTVGRIKQLKEYINENNLNVEISVDGGINNETGLMCKEAGVDMLVSATYLHNDLKNNIDILKNL